MTDSARDELHRTSDELHRLAEEFRKLLDNSNSPCKIEQTTPEQLVQRFGLTLEEARAWLETESNYLADAFSHDSKQSKSSQHLIKGSVKSPFGLGSCEKPFGVLLRMFGWGSVTFRVMN
jgi:hypothetical protein